MAREQPPQTVSFKCSYCGSSVTAIYTPFHVTETCPSCHGLVQIPKPQGTSVPAQGFPAKVSGEWPAGHYARPGPHGVEFGPPSPESQPAPEPDKNPTSHLPNSTPTRSAAAARHGFETGSDKQDPDLFEKLVIPPEAMPPATAAAPLQNPPNPPRHPLALLARPRSNRRGRWARRRRSFNPASRPISSRCPNSCSSGAPKRPSRPPRREAPRPHRLCRRRKCRRRQPTRPFELSAFRKQERLVVRRRLVVGQDSHLPRRRELGGLGDKPHPEASGTQTRPAPPPPPPSQSPLKYCRNRPKVSLLRPDRLPKTAQRKVERWHCPPTRSVPPILQLAQALKAPAVTGPRPDSRHEHPTRTHPPEPDDSELESAVSRTGWLRIPTQRSRRSPSPRRNPPSPWDRRLRRPRPGPSKTSRPGTSPQIHPAPKRTSRPSS